MARDQRLNYVHPLGPRLDYPQFFFGAFCQGMLGLTNCLPTHGFSILNPPKVELLAAEQKATEFGGRGGHRSAPKLCTHFGVPNEHSHPKWLGSCSPSERSNGHLHAMAMTGTYEQATCGQG